MERGAEASEAMSTPRPQSAFLVLDASQPFCVEGCYYSVMIGYPLGLGCWWGAMVQATSNIRGADSSTEGKLSVESLQLSE